MAEEKIPEKVALLNNLVILDAFKNIENQKLSTELFYLNDELQVLDKRLKILLNKIN